MTDIDEMRQKQMLEYGTVDGIRSDFTPADVDFFSDTEPVVDRTLYACSRIRQSSLKHMAKSPAHYLDARENGVSVSAAMRVGTIAHGLVLGGPRAPVVYHAERRGNAWKEFQADHPGREIVTIKEVEKSQAIADAIQRHPTASRLLSGNREQELHWDINGRLCQSTPDAFTEDHLTELKVTADSSPGKFPWHARRMGWLAQLSFYQAAIRHAHGFTPRDTYIVAAESKRPYPVTVYKLTAAALDQGERQWRAWWEQLMVCEAADHWPGYTEAVEDLDAGDDGPVELEFEEEAA